MDTIRVLIVDDHTLVREGLKSLIENHGDITVVGSAQDGEQALALAKELQPDVVLMDISMRGMNGLEATRRVHEQYPHIRVLVLTQFEDPPLVVSMLQAGASGYILKRALAADLVNAIRAVSGGGAFLDSDIAAILVNEASDRQAKHAVSEETLTPREKEVLAHIAHGKTNSEIAQALSVSLNTVVWHRANLMSKLGVHRVADLVRYAFQKGLVEESHLPD
jgi:two-component system response regulator NreC